MCKVQFQEHANDHFITIQVKVIDAWLVLKDTVGVFPLRAPKKPM